MLTHSLRPSTLALLALFALGSGCGESTSDSTSAAPSYPTTPRTVFGGERPVTLQVPSTYDVTRPAPLLVVLHGYGANGAVQAQYLRVVSLVESAGILLLAPDGTVDASGNRFWNATDGCCNFNGSTVDDVAYIRGLITDVRHDYNVDAKRIYLIVHSNGAFMSHRMACDDAAEIAAIVSLAGATFQDATKCKPSAPVSILDIHGDADDTVLYDGGTIGDPYPSEMETMAHWQVYDTCAAGLVSDPTTLNLDFRLPGNETAIQRFDGCAHDTGVELWTIHGGAHIPTLSNDFSPDVWRWLTGHPKA